MLATMHVLHHNQNKILWTPFWLFRQKKKKIQMKLQCWVSQEALRFGLVGFGCLVHSLWYTVVALHHKHQVVVVAFTQQAH